MRAARDAGDLPVSTVWCEQSESTRIVFRSRRLLTGIPRAMGYGLIPAEPRRTDQASLLGQALLSAADRELSPDAPYVGHTHAPVPGAPCGARRNAHRTQQASTAATSLHTPAAATAPDPHIEHACRTCPSWIETRMNIILYPVKSSPEFSARRGARRSCASRTMRPENHKCITDGPFETHRFAMLLGAREGASRTKRLIPRRTLTSRERGAGACRPSRR